MYPREMRPLAKSRSDVLSRVALSLCLATTGCVIDRGALSPGDARPDDLDARVDDLDARPGDLDARPGDDDAGLDAFLALPDAPRVDARREDDARLEPDSARGDAGSDAGPCPDGPTGTGVCPFTTLAQLVGVAAGTYEFAMAGRTFQGVVDDGGGGGWLLVASADETTRGPVGLSRTTTGPVTRQSHDIFAPGVVAALPDARELRIDSSPGSAVVASVQSTDTYVLDQFRSYRSLHAVPAEGGAIRWRGADARRMTSTCPNTPPEALDRLIFQTCGAAGANLHWCPNSASLGGSPDRLNSWVYLSSMRDRLNLWVRY